jgi:uncharacterized membrane protein YkvA (DUF1232 family)
MRVCQTLRSCDGAPPGAGSATGREGTCHEEKEAWMPLKLVLELSDRDLEHYRTVMEAKWRRNAERGEKALLEGTRRLLAQVRSEQVPEYVRKRLDDLGTLVSMLEDAEWALEDKHRTPIVAAMSYFADSQDMVPDKVPGLGYLDDALMAELVIRELKHELDAYRDFCKYRALQEERRGKAAHVTREDWLAAKRRQLIYRIERRREERRRHHSTEPPTPPILRYHS